MVSKSSTAKSKILSPAKLAAGMKTRAEKSAEKKAAQQAAFKALPKAADLRRKVDRDVRQAQKKNSPLMADNKRWNREKVMRIVCERTATTTKSLKAVLCEPHEGWELPGIVTVLLWIAEDREVSSAYARAKSQQADVMTDEMLSIADDGLNDTYIDEQGNARTDNDVLGRSKLRIDTRKWIAAKLKPQKYGDSLKLTGDPEAPLVSTQLPTDPVEAAAAYKKIMQGGG